MNSDLQAQLVWLPILVLIFCAVAWWAAKRDLSARAAEERARTQTEWDDVRAAAEQLIEDLERRATTAEEKISALESLLTQAERSAVQPSKSTTAAETEDSRPIDDRYLEVTKLASGGFEPAEIARKTGLSRGEVELVLALHGRRFL